MLEFQDRDAAGRGYPVTVTQPGRGCGPAESDLVALVRTFFSFFSHVSNPNERAQRYKGT